MTRTPHLRAHAPIRTTMPRAALHKESSST
jgi:hypothetical protein